LVLTQVNLEKSLILNMVFPLYTFPSWESQAIKIPHQHERRKAADYDHSLMVSQDYRIKIAT